MVMKVLALAFVVACGSHGDSNAGGAKRDAAPAPAPPVAKLAGNVAVEQSQPLYPTAAAARAHAKDPIVAAEPIALKVIADHGDVIEVTTEPAQDCLRDPYRGRGYALSVFVPRAVLIPRAAAPTTATYPDGTAVTVDRGALVSRQPSAWRDEVLAATPLAPARTTLAVPPADVAAELPRATGEKMVCDQAPEPVSKWLARKRKAHHPAPARRAPSRSDSASSLADALADMGGDSDAALEHDAPSCGLVDGAAKLTVGGHTVPRPRDAGGEEVYATPAGARVDVYLQCARVRLSTDPQSIGVPSGGGGLLEGGRREWTMHAGKVVWPDGTPAGTFTESKDYFERDVEARGDLLCVHVDGVAEKVCHHKADAKRN